MWGKLVERRLNSRNEERCLGGDFNEVCCREEHIGVRIMYSRRNMKAFKEFLVDMGVIDVLCVGETFTWFKGNGKDMSRLDRFLLSSKLIYD